MEAQSDQLLYPRVLPISTNNTPYYQNISSIEASNKVFIEANTTEVTSEHLKNDCIIPVFSKDNEVTISHNSFIEAVYEASCKMFRNETIKDPSIRVSHIIKGRTPDAIYKSVSQLQDTDKTIYYQRMAFCFEIPTIYETIDGNRLNMTIGGVRAYNQENLYSRKGIEKFKVFIGFKNLVCCNLCISTDGLCDNLQVSSINELIVKVIELIAKYNVKEHITLLSRMNNYELSQHQFAQLIGKTRLYQFLPQSLKKSLPVLSFCDSHINTIARHYYENPTFGLTDLPCGTIDMWRVYNLFTEANKSSYIDSFLSRGVNATDFCTGLCLALEGNPSHRWFLE